MKVMMEIKMPHEPFNTFIREGIAGKKMNEVLEAVKPALRMLQGAKSRRRKARPRGERPGLEC